LEESSGKRGETLSIPVTMDLRSDKKTSASHRRAKMKPAQLEVSAKKAEPLGADGQPSLKRDLELGVDFCFRLRRRGEGVGGREG